MRPFRDLVLGYPRMVRDLARQLGKRARLTVVGEALEVRLLTRAQLGAGLANTHVLTTTAITASSKEAKRLISEKGLRFNNELVVNPNDLVTADMIGSELKVSVGKKKHFVVRLAD